MLRSFSPTPIHLRSLNECNVRPKRTSYCSMSTWFFMDQKNATFHKDDDYYVTDIDGDPVSDKYGKIPKYKTKHLPDPRNLWKDPAVGNFLMKNWSNERDDANRMITNDRPDIQRIKGRAGSGGSWQNITQANKSDGKRLVFVNNNIASQFDPKPEPQKVQTPKILAPSIKTRVTGSGRKLTKAYLEKLELDRIQRGGIQTRYGIENGNWKIIR